MDKVKCVLLNMSQSAASMEIVIFVLVRYVESILSTVARHARMKGMHIIFQAGAQINDGAVYVYMCACVCMIDIMFELNFREELTSLQIFLI